ncbi:hypothetical protein PAHAL_1G056400 [Panicum hallii]|jgi:hypothetical protein|uniref:WRC domain-containing protein n=1 Tax=Panicum hallii TaxID=206008 RepID=A0A2T8KU26_9POAL|nr:hypothetical protein PAHAL_1G056400 [Panicum hallii]
MKSLYFLVFYLLCLVDSFVNRKCLTDPRTDHFDWICAQNEPLGDRCLPPGSSKILTTHLRKANHKAKGQKSKTGKRRKEQQPAGSPPPAPALSARMRTHAARRGAGRRPGMKHVARTSVKLLDRPRRRGPPEKKRAPQTESSIRRSSEAHACCWTLTLCSIC